MGDIIGGLVSGGGESADLTTQIGFSVIFNLIWKIIFAIMQKAGLYTELSQYGVDLTKYINTDVSPFGN
jgi:hypothetical protein